MFDFSMGTYLMGVLIALLSGGIVMGVLRWRKSKYQITTKEFIIGALVLVFVTTPLVSLAGTKIARANAVGGYVEFWDGSITAAESQETTCTRDGSCVHEYSCDPYTETEYYTVSVASGRDSKGNTTYRSETRSREVTKYHDCPYATHEYSYSLKDSFGEEHTIASHIFAANPQTWRGSSLPDGVARGVPEEWRIAGERIAAGDAPWATKINTYTNYLLAAEGSNLRAYSPDIEKYRRAGLLLPHTQNYQHPIFNGYMAKKVVTAGGFKLQHEDLWQEGLAQYNAKLGMTETLRGDLHLLVVPANRVDNPDAYANAQLAYLQGPEFGKYSLAKNAIMLIVGVQDVGGKQMVVWSRAKTGLPVGNGAMLTALNTQLAGLPFEPTHLLGRPKAVIKDGKPQYSYGGGVVERIMTIDYPYKRPCMDCKDKGESGGFVYLKSEAFISFWSKFWIVTFGVLIAGAIWALFAWLPLFEPVHNRLGTHHPRRNYPY